MAGVKRRSRYRKNVETATLDEMHEPEEGQLICRVVASRGSNLMDVSGGHRPGSAAPAWTAPLLAPSFWRLCDTRAGFTLPELEGTGATAVDVARRC